MNESFNPGSIKKNLINLSVGVMATIGSISVQNQNVEAQTNNLPKDKNQNKTENATYQKDLIFHNTPEDAGFKYPFDKVYKSDEKFYRSVAFGQSMDQNIAKQKANIKAKSKLLAETGKQIATMSNIKIIVIEEKTFYNEETKKYTTVIAIEIDKNDVQ